MQKIRLHRHDRTIDRLRLKGVKSLHTLVSETTINKIMKNFILSICAFLSVISIQAQEIQGIVYDENGQALSWATISAFSKLDSILINGTLSEEDGTFTLQLENLDQTFLEVDYLGYQKSTIQDPTVGPEIKVVLVPDSEQLDEVVIKAKKPTIAFSKGVLSYTVNESHSVGDNGLDVLASVPLLRLDKHENVILRNKSVKILIDGKDFHLAGEELKAYLKTINGDQLAKIEVITNPSAKWEAEGNTGIVNIILKQKPQGHFTNLNVYSGYGQYGKIGGGISSSFQNNKLGVAVEANPYYGKSINVKNIDRTNTLTNTTFNQTDTWLPTTLLLNGKLSCNYDHNEKHSSSVFYKSSYSDGDEQTNSSTKISGSQNEKIGLNVQNEVMTTRNTVGFGHDIKVDTLGSLLSFEYLHIGAQTQNQNTQTNIIESDGSNSLFNIGMDNQFKYLINSGKVDFEKKLKTADLSLGAKFSNVNNDSRQDYSFDDTAKNLLPFEIFNDAYSYNEKIFATYASFAKEKEALSYTLGLRMEHTAVSGTSVQSGQVNRSYTYLFPNLSVNYTTNKEANISFSASRRINRPYYQNLNPAISFIDLYSYSQGNPLVNPSLSTNFDLSYQKGALVVSLFSNNSTGEIDELLVQDNETSVIAMRPINTLSGRDAGIEINRSFAVGQNASIDASAYFGYIESNININEVEQKFSSNYHGVNLSFGTELWEKLSLNTRFSYSSSAQYGIYRSQPQFYSNFSLAWDADPVTISFKFHDPFNWSQWNSEIDFDHIQATWVNRWENRKAYITLRYKFGNTDLRGKGRYSKSTSNEESRRM